MLTISLLLGALFARGRAARRGQQRRAWRDLAFVAGVGLFACSSAWPLEAIAHDRFSVHEVEFLALRIAAPMLIALSHPLTTLFRGMLRRAGGAPLLRRPWGRLVRRGARLLGRAPLALLAYLATLFLWAVPELQDRALASTPIALFLHLSLFVTGLLFWSRIFDTRSGPRAVPHGTRLMMLWLAILAQILIGSATSLKSAIWYPAYGGGMADEAVGGILLWIPSSLLTLIGLLFVVHLWGRHETRLDLRRTSWSPSNSAILLYPQTARALRTLAAAKNRRLALSMLAFVLFIFSAALIVAVAYRFS